MGHLEVPRAAYKAASNQAGTRGRLSFSGPESGDISGPFGCLVRNMQRGSFLSSLSVPTTHTLLSNQEDCEEEEGCLSVTAMQPPMPIKADKISSSRSVHSFCVVVLVRNSVRRERERDDDRASSFAGAKIQAWTISLSLSHWY